MDSGEILLIDFDAAHLDGALSLSVEAGWPHRRQDWEMVLQLSVGVVALDGTRVVGTVLATPFGTDSATINMVIVAKAARGHGLGRRLVQAALDRCKGRDCRLTATRDGLPLYEKLGFKAAGAIQQHQGVSPGGEAPANVAWATIEDIPTLAKLDRQACGMDRNELIVALAAKGRIAVLRQDNQIGGFAGLRTFGSGEVVGPMVATSDDNARDLLSFVFAARPGAFLRVDTLDAAALGPWLTAQGLPQVGGGIAMRRGAIHAAPPATPFQTYALASQALG